MTKNFKHTIPLLHVSNISHDCNIFCFVKLSDCKYNLLGFLSAMAIVLFVV
jgi:hypothetical protein